MERVESLGTREEYYNAEFVANGLDNLKLVMPGPKGHLESLLFPFFIPHWAI
jgi:hypothetical protein